LRPRNERTPLCAWKFIHDGGDGVLFVREDAVEAAWAIVDPILANATTLHQYEPGSWGPREADRLALDVGGWHNPKEHKESTADGPKAA
jgi:glucose-6-phosphate 1-dehydrogenase